MADVHKAWLAHTLTPEDILPVVLRLAEERGVDLSIRTGTYILETHEKGAQHIARLIHRVYQWSEMINPHEMGGFLTAVVENNLHEAVSRADNVNQRGLVLYVLYFYNYAPMDWRIQKKREPYPE